MKKKLLLVALVAPLLTVSAQWTQTGGVVKINPDTYKYVSGNYEVKDAADGVSNEGNVNVRGNFTTPSVAGSVSKFVNKFDENNSKNYGQLIVNQTATATGSVSSEFKNTDVTKFYYQPIAIPFSGLTADKIAGASGITSGQQWINYTAGSGYNPNRYKNPIFSWDNEKYQLDHLASGDNITSTKPYSVNQGFYNLNAQKRTYTGTLTNGQLTYSGNKFTVGANQDENDFGERLFTYLDDWGDNMPSGWLASDYTSAPVSANGYASNVFYFGNPYTSNLDLGKVFPESSTKATHIFQFGNNDYKKAGTPEASGSTQGLQMIAAKVGGKWGGAGIAALTVRPFHVFGVKFKGTLITSNFTNTIPEDAKTFDARDGAMAYRGGDKLYQIEMNLLNEDSDKISRFYVIAHDSYQAAAKEGNEAYNLTIKDNTGFFTLQENEDGSVAEELRHNKVLINGINTSYVAKPINVVMQVAKPGNFTIKGVLSDDLLGSGNRFYFEDKEAGQILEITPEFSYVFDAKESSDDRFKIYWNGLPDQMSVDDTAIGKTLVYKDGRDYKVRFDNNWKEADVYVYNMIGQLVHVAKKVSTINDYLLPINGDPAAYIVKVIGDNGDVVTKKIVK